MRSWYAIRARAEGTEVSIYDEIGAYGVSAKSFLDELGALPGDGPLTLRLNSPGGSVFDAVAIYNALKRHPGPVNVRIDRLLHRHGRRRGGDAGERLPDDPRSIGVRHGHRRGHAGHGGGARQD
jgi:hypothetical protein